MNRTEKSCLGIWARVDRIYHLGLETQRKGLWTHYIYLYCFQGNKILGPLGSAGLMSFSKCVAYISPDHPTQEAEAGPGDRGDWAVTKSTGCAVACAGPGHWCLEPNFPEREKKISTTMLNILTSWLTKTLQIAGMSRVQAKLSWTIFNPLSSHLPPISTFDKTPLWLSGKISFGMYKQVWLSPAAG